MKTLIDWSNIDLNSEYERDLDILSSYDFDTLLLEINCNVKEINKLTVLAQFEESLKANIETARSIVKDNLANIVKKAKEERES